MAETAAQKTSDCLPASDLTVTKSPLGLTLSYKATG